MCDLICNGEGNFCIKQFQGSIEKHRIGMVKPRVKIRELLSTTTSSSQKQTTKEKVDDCQKKGSFSIVYCQKTYVKTI